MLMRPLTDLEDGLDEICRSPVDVGELRLIVRRPGPDLREPIETGRLDVAEGLVGDGWRARGSTRTDDGSADPAAQVTIMNSRVATLLAGEPAAWAAAGDQLYVDFDLAESNLPPGTRLAVGEAVLEVSATWHTGCAKFSARFGPDALRFVSTPVGRALRLRGLNATVVEGGSIRVGDRISKVSG